MAASARPAPRRAPARAGIRWDRISRYALLAVFVVLIALYVNPLRNYFATRSDAADRQQTVTLLEREQAALEARKRSLTEPRVIEAEARRLGMVRPGERAFVVRGLPRGG